MNANKAVPFRDVRFGPNQVTLTHGAHGSMYVKSIYPLGGYLPRLTDSLDYWAAKAPDRVFLAQRDGSGAWRSLTYAQARGGARAT